ncbi:MAG: hypothetical protein BroJett018_32560 [Chloroflexota bacterium]|nr:hypothetical protein [Chloroflexota bacterium]NOG62344.1 hypothetical protein [Chloroflexota bacterium]GIK65462.1 MAG: hypothetical protein BroJett018_32560 [Chloroflexota bacterium]
MAEYIAFDDQVEVVGRSALFFFSAIGNGIQPFIEKHHLTNIDPQGWYPLQAFLDIYREIAQIPGGMFDLVSIGMRIPEEAIFPPDIDSIESALMSIDTAYHMNHRGGDIGYYQATLVQPRHFVIECRNPYPSDLDYGLIYGLVRRFRPPKTNFTVWRDENLPSRKNGAESCTFHVTWE